MGFFKKSSDPISERSSQLTARIAELESRIKKLSQDAAPEDPRRFRSTAYPPGSRPARACNGAANGDLVFERVDQKQLKEVPEPLPTAKHDCETGPRKFDLFERLEGIRKHFRGPPAANPKLVNYLAAGNIQGLRPLRYEKRVARNRFVALTMVLVIVLFGLFCFLARRH
jgi:hypothetical protein